MFQTVLENYNGVETFPLDTFIPVEFPKDKKIWFRIDPKLDDYLTSRSVCIALNHSQAKPWVYTASLESIMKRDCLLSEVFRYSEKIGGIL